jgi:hypothetical protein
MTIRQPTGLTTKFYAAAAFSVALGAAVLATSAPARADEDGVSLDKQIFGGILQGLGLRKDGEAINYQERAPLVIPPSRSLPPPEKGDAVLANNPAWPKDPDVVRRKRDVERERNRNVSDEREREQNPLRQDQLTPGGNPRTAAGQPQGAPNSPTPGDRFSATEMKQNQKGNMFGNMFRRDEPEIAKFTKEPPRAALTEPPPGYQTPSPDQPYGLSGKETAPKATDYKETHGTVDGGM